MKDFVLTQLLYASAVLYGKIANCFSYAFPCHESCRGVSFPSIGRWKLELWFAPKGYKIKPHSHPNQDIKLMFLFGHNTTFFRCKRGTRTEQQVRVTWSHFGKVFNIRAGDIHWFSVSNYPLVFLNLEKWYIKPTTAAHDFKELK